VFGPAHDGVEGLDRKLAEGDRITVPKLGVELGVLDVPGTPRGTSPTSVTGWCSVGTPSSGAAADASSRARPRRCGRRSRRS